MSMLLARCTRVRLRRRGPDCGIICQAAENEQHNRSLLVSAIFEAEISRVRSERRTITGARERRLSEGGHSNAVYAAVRTADIEGADIESDELVEFLMDVGDLSEIFSASLRVTDR